MAVINDRIEKAGQTNKYLMNVEFDKNSIVTFRLMEGSCRLEIMDANNLLFNSSFTTGEKDYQDITVQAIDIPTEDNKDEASLSDKDDWSRPPTTYLPVRVPK